MPDAETDPAGGGAAVPRPRRLGERSRLGPLRFTGARRPSGAGRSGSSAVAAALFSFLLCLVIGTAATLRRGAPASDARIVQPIVFDHKKHVQDLELECSACHPYYQTETFSGLPGPEICALCHLEPQGESPEEMKLVDVLKSGAPLEWKPLFQQPAHVFYSHRRHVAVAGIACSVCHGDIAESARPPEQVVRLTMDDCVRCHEEQGASTDCTACHR